MPAVETIPHAVVRRAAAIARGPHACPTCECPTFAEPPVPWTDLRDYVVRCDACERPMTVRVDRSRILRRNAVPRHVRLAPDLHDPVAELLDTRGRRAFAMRLLAALTVPVAVASIALQAGATPFVALVLATVAALPGALWAPALLALAAEAVSIRVQRLHEQVDGRFHRTPRQESTIEVAPGRWDQWLREEKLRQRERYANPEAVLRELERVLDERELRRVRALALRGDVPFDHLDDLLRFRRSWTTVA
jgi:hypothetical protein